MKLNLALATLTAGASLYAADPAAVATYVGHEKVAAALSKGGAIASGSGFTVGGYHREKAGQVEVHDKETDVIHVIDGEATFVTGGAMVGGKATKPGQSVGSDITNGETHQLTAGDVIVVPAGMPHWFKIVPHSVSYYVVKVIKP
jgi:quercetin dioxygenase-like cupin family protein